VGEPGQQLSLCLMALLSMTGLSVSAVNFGPCPRGAGTEVTAGCQLPMVGVPDPIAIAKTCSAVIPLPTPALTVGSVTEATVLPA
jgi:hypothetical protein